MSNENLKKMVNAMIEKDVEAAKTAYHAYLATAMQKAVAAPQDTPKED